MIAALIIIGALYIFALIGQQNRLTEPTVADVCDRFPGFHENPAAFKKAGGDALFAACEVKAGMMTEQDVLADMAKRYPGISDDCARGLMGNAYAVLREDPKFESLCN